TTLAFDGMCAAIAVVVIVGSGIALRGIVSDRAADDGARDGSQAARRTMSDLVADHRTDESTDHRSTCDRAIAIVTVVTLVGHVACFGVALLPRHADAHLLVMRSHLRDACVVVSWAAVRTVVVGRISLVPRSIVLPAVIRISHRGGNHHQRAGQ